MLFQTWLQARWRNKTCKLAQFIYSPFMNWHTCSHTTAENRRAATAVIELLTSFSPLTPLPPPPTLFTHLIGQTLHITYQPLPSPLRMSLTPPQHPPRPLLFTHAWEPECPQRPGAQVKAAGHSTRRWEHVRQHWLSWWWNIKNPEGFFCLSWRHFSFAAPVWPPPSTSSVCILRSSTPILPNKRACYYRDELHGHLRTVCSSPDATSSCLSAGKRRRFQKTTGNRHKQRCALKVRTDKISGSFRISEASLLCCH